MKEVKEVIVYNLEGKETGKIKLNPKIFGLKVVPGLIQQAVVIQQANSRNVIAHAKDRSEVRGGGRKPWRQKGTGRARHGSIRSPLWVGGGVTFGPSKNRNFSLKINRTAKRKAMLMALSDRAQNNQLILVEDLKLAEPKTKLAYQVLKNLKLRALKEKDKNIAPKREKSVLIIIPDLQAETVRAFKNIPKIRVVAAQNLNVLEVVNNYNLLMTKSAIEKIAKTFLNQK